jgi:SAM-dependent methyltransferase
MRHTRAMEGYGPASYGDSIADIYDRLYDGLFDTEGAVELLAELAAGGRALELGIGTGRIALPLAARGVTVEGVDSSAAMVDKLRAKPGGEQIPVSLSDFRAPEVSGPFDLVYIVFNTFFGLTSQEDQIACFEAVEKLLAPRGCFVLEVFVPDLSRFVRNQNLEVVEVRLDEVHLSAGRHDPVGQSIDSQHVLVSQQGTKLVPVRIRYSWPAELDLMARLAGLRLAARWSDWRRGPFDSDSRGHVSVYRSGAA